MDQWFLERYNIGIKLFLIIYIAFKSYINKVSLAIIILFILMTIILNLAYFILNIKINKVFIFLDGIFNLYLAFKYMPYGVFMYSMNVLELFSDERSYYLVKIVAVLAPVYFFTNKEFITIYCIFSSTILLFISFYDNTKKSLVKSELDSEDKRREIDALKRNLKKQEEAKDQSIYNLRLQERNKLSESMHDKVGHTIAGALMQLEAVKIVMAKDGEKAKSMLDNTTNALRIGMDDIRKTLREIRPTNEELGINKIKAMLNEKVRNTRFSFSLNHNGDMEKISYEQWIIFTKTVTELSTNCFKYSSGNKIEINIDVFNKIVKLSFKDNGDGQTKFKKGIGIRTIEENILEHDGKLLIYPSEGFNVVLLLPIKE